MIQQQEKQNFLNTFNPSEQARFSAFPTRCITGKAPSLVKVKQLHGEQTMITWLEIQLFDLSEFAGCKEKLTTRHVKEIAWLIFNKAYFLKVTELMLFFSLFKSGEYGHFYGSVDGMRILEALGDFLAWRWSEKGRIDAQAEREQREQEEAENRKHSISWDEYKKLNGLTDDDFPIKTL